LTADGGERGHGQSDHDVDLVGLLVLGNALAADAPTEEKGQR